jgi:hypothetical protein
MHSLAQTVDGAHRFAARGKAAWHDLGTVFDQDAEYSPSEAIVVAHCDYHVRKFPMTIALPDGPKAADQVAIVRVPQESEGSYHILGYASPSFEVVQNYEVGFMLDELGRQWPVETVGALGDGEQFFITLDAGSATVAGEEIRQYLLISNSHDGKRAMHIALTHVRVVCKNTLMTGLNAAVLRAAIPHRSDIRDDAQFTLNLISSVRKQQAAMLAEFEALAAAPVEPADVDNLLEKIYPDPTFSKRKQVAGIISNDSALQGMVNDNREVATRLLQDLKTYGKEYDDKLVKVRGLRDLVRERHGLLQEEAPAIAGSAWGMYQSVTEVENFRGKGGKATSVSILQGERAANMGRAYKVLVDYSGIGSK